MSAHDRDDLGIWTPQQDGYDLVVCLYVHAAGSVEDMVQRMATGVVPGGTLLLVGHQPIDPATGRRQDRPRPTAGTGVDAVIRARRRPLT